MRRLIPFLAIVTLWLALAGGRAWSGANCQVGAPAASATCSPGYTYGVQLSTTPVTVLAIDTDGPRNCIQLFADPNNGSGNNVCVAFGATANATSPPNCIQLVPGQSYLLFNLPGGNSSTIIPNTPLSAVASSGTANLTYTYC